MANQYVSGSLGELVRVQGEQLARLTAIVEQDHEDLAGLKHSTAIIADAVARQETRESLKVDTKSKLFYVFIPLLAAILSGIAGHFIR